MDLNSIGLLLQSNPQILGGLLQNPDGFAKVADSLNLPLPGSEEMQNITQPFNAFGGTLLGNNAIPENPLSGGPPPVQPQASPTASPMMDPRQLMSTADILGIMNPNPGAGQLGGPTPGGMPGTQPALQQQQQPMGRITPPKPGEAEYRAGVAGTPKPPSEMAAVKNNLTPAQS